MKLAVEFASVAYREGTDGITRLAKGIEDIGYDQLDVYDHVVMGYDDVPGRAKSYYPSQMPILEAFMMLAYAAAVTDRIGLGSEVLVLPQRQPALVAKQVSTLDTLSNGRVRLGVGIGWQESEYEALGENFRNRGKRMDEAMGLLRTYWRDARVDFESAYYPTTAMAMVTSIITLTMILLLLAASTFGLRHGSLRSILLESHKAPLPALTT